MTWQCGLKKLTKWLDKLMKNGNGFNTWQIGHTKMNVAQQFCSICWGNFIFSYLQCDLGGLIHPQTP
jgi:hypothetical protein